MHLDALRLVTQLHLLALCRVAVRLAYQRCPSAHHPPRRGLLGPQADCLDSYHAGRRCSHPWNPKRQKQQDGLPPTWTAEELGKWTSIERFFGRVLVFFRLQRPPVFGWSAAETRAALTYTAVWVIALEAWQAGRPEFIRSLRLVLAHVWEGWEM